MVVDKPVRKRNVSSQSPVASTSTSARSQLDTGHASIRPLQSGPTPVDSSSAVSSSVVSPPSDTSNVAVLNTYGSASQPGQHVGYLSQSKSAPADNRHDSAGIDQGRQPPLPEPSSLPEPSLGPGHPQHQATAHPSSSASSISWNQHSVNHSSSPNYVQQHLQSGQMHTTHHGFQGQVPASYQSSSAADVPLADQSGLQAAPVAPMGGPPPVPVTPEGGPPPEPGTLSQYPFGSGVSEGPDDLPTQSHDNANNPPLNNFEYPINDDTDPFMGYQSP